MAWVGASEAPRWQVRWVEETGSTNADLLDAARAGAPEGTVLAADYQTAGRGRRDRTWTAPSRSALLVSVLVRPRLAPGRLATVTRAVALAAADACAAVAGVRAAIKWPNDLMVGEQKLAGLLAESVVRPDGTVEAVVVGVGLNVAWPDPVPVEIAGIATALDRECGHAVDRVAMLDALLATLGRLDPDTVERRYRAELATIGREVRAVLVGEELVGRALDVRADGALVIGLADGSRRAVTAGDVVHLRDG
jgi:BirA family transcriptional regulator, biotin operon repressor / biotin---[acetyl-CoA-carboxylase] ligase